MRKRKRLVIRVDPHDAVVLRVLLSRAIEDFERHMRVVGSDYEPAKKALMAEYKAQLDACADAVRKAFGG